METAAFTSATQRELDRREFLKAAGAVAVLGIAGGLGGGLLSGCAPTRPAKSGVPSGYSMVRIVGSTIGSGTSTAVIAYAKVLNKYYPEIEWSTASGATSVNAVQLTNGAVQLAGMLPTGYVESYGWEKVPQSRLRSIAKPLPVLNYLFLIPSDKPWKDITQVPKGTNLCPGSPGTTVPAACEAWINVCGLTKAHFNWLPLGKSEMADSWRAGKIDVAFSNVESAAPWLMDMATSPRKPKAMGLTQEQGDKAKSERTFDRLGFLPPSMSNIVELLPDVFSYDVTCPKNVNHIVSRDDFPEEIAYKMGRVFDERHEELVQTFRSFKYDTPQSHIEYAKPPLELHAGVARYYREKGYLK